MCRFRPTLNATRIRNFVLVAAVAFSLDVTAFIGTILLVQRNPWALAFLAASTVTWAVCISMTRSRGNIIPLVVGVVLGGWVALSWPS